MTELLSVRRVSLSFAGVRALDAVDVRIDEGELVGIITDRDIKRQKER